VDAVKATFDRREIKIDEAQLTVFTNKFMQDENKQKQWAAFLGKNSLEHSKSFEELMGLLQTFLEPVYQSISPSQSFVRQWNMSDWQWLAIAQNKV